MLPWRDAVAFVGLVAPEPTETAATEASPTFQAELLQLVANRPGLSMREAVRKLSTTWGTLEYHVRRLEESGALVRRRIGSRALLFPAADPLHPDAEELALLAEPAVLRVAASLAERPHASVNDLARRLGLTPRSVYPHVRRLLDGGLLTSASSINPRGLAPTPRLYELLASLL